MESQGWARIITPLSLCTNLLRGCKACRGGTSKCKFEDHNYQAAKVSPLKAVAEGLGILLQVYVLLRLLTRVQAIEDDNVRRADIVKQLTRIERVATRVTENFPVHSRKGTRHMQVRGIDAITTVIQVFNAALVYKSASFPRESWL